MSELRERMVEEMQLRRYAERTQRSYLEAVTKLVRHVGKTPERDYSGRIAWVLFCI